MAYFLPNLGSNMLLILAEAKFTESFYKPLEQYLIPSVVAKFGKNRAH